MLRAFFEIEAGEGETELTKSYRRKAKETHPDLYGGDTAKFQEVQDKYQRARELLGRRGTPTS
jgi:curved DNA-binding protein CbpA